MKDIPFQMYEGNPLGVASYRPVGIGAGQFDPMEIGIASFAWGEPATTRLRRQADSSITYATGVNSPTTLQHVGLLKSLRLISRLQVVLANGSGAAARDPQGPWNLFANLLIRVSGLDLLFQVSGWGAYLIDLVNDRLYAPDVNPSVVTNAAATAQMYDFPTTSGELLFSLKLPFTIPMLGFEDLGLWLIQNETVNMEVVPTFNNLGGAVHLVQPYDLTGTASASVTSGNVAIWREFYGVPAKSEDMPPLGYVHQWEEQYNAISGSQVDIDHQRGGILTRLLYQVVDADSVGDDSGVIQGINNTNLSGLEFKFDANDTPFDEDVYQVLARQRELYDRDLPQGVFTHDQFLNTRTLQDAYNTENYINLKTRFRFAKSLVSGSYIRTLRERLLPVVVNTQG